MLRQLYYIKKAPYDNAYDTSRPLIINCTGYIASTKKFTSEAIRHDYYLQLVDVGSLTLGDGSTLGTDSFIIRTPETAYKYTNDGSPLGYYWVHFTGSHAAELLSSLGIKTDCIHDISSVDVERIKRDFSHMFNEIMLRRDGFEEMCSSLLQAILVRLSRRIVDNPNREQNAHLRTRLKKSLEAINSTYCEKLVISELAALEHLSESRFRQLFRAALGTSPVDYITSLRLTRACELLSTTDLSVTEIAHECGFDDEPYFCRVFNKKIGTSPLSYRKSV